MNKFIEDDIKDNNGQDWEWEDEWTTPDEEDNDALANAKFTERGRVNLNYKPTGRPRSGAMDVMRRIAALFVEADGCYFGLPDVEPWPESRDARKYAGTLPVVAHPPCQRWGRFWHGSTRSPHQYKLGDDGGCFEFALKAVKQWGGVIEHPAHSRAWQWFGLRAPQVGAGWQPAGIDDGWTCYVEQGHYGHESRKPTWLLVYGVAHAELPQLNWTKCAQRLPEWMVERYGYEKARRIGVVAMVGGKNKTAIRNRTPLPFRDVLLSIARQAQAA